MAKTAFNATILAGMLNRAFAERLVIGSITNRNYEGDIKNPGDTVKIVRPLGTTIRPYTSGTDITVDELDASEATLVCDQADYFAFFAHDTDNIARYAQVFVQEDAGKLLAAADRYVLGQYAQAAGAVTKATAGDFVEAVREARAVLTKANAPDEGRWLVIGPDELKLVEDKLAQRQTTMGDQTLRAGFAGQLAGFDVYVSNALKETGTTPKYRHALAGHISAVTFAGTVSQIETMRSENRFADLVRGLHCYGAKVVRPEGLVDLRVQIA